MLVPPASSGRRASSSRSRFWYSIGLTPTAARKCACSMEALRVELTPFGIHTTVVNPGFFRTELLSAQSTNYTEPSVAAYDERRTALLAGWKGTHGQQSGDPAKLAQALVTIVAQEPPPRRFLAGADAIATAEQKIADRQADVESNRQLSASPAPAGR